VSLVIYSRLGNEETSIFFAINEKKETRIFTAWAQASLGIVQFNLACVSSACIPRMQ
jgi:hypothetical protein